ncbi:MAG: hypothetical protein TREMPRED_001069 [Tremellales sp. Tagirdzhanova-0007]|nr:MAG: hypothetical protein TREMPRED_001069 [Tremellales sp. Tagirdzhanova-0007]
MVPAPASRPTKRSGKENVLVARIVKSKAANIGEESADESDSFGGFSVDEAPAKSSKSTLHTAKSSSQSLKSSTLRLAETEEDVEAVENDQVESEKRKGEFHRRLTAMTLERDRMRTQRDTFSKQFEELSKTRSTDVEGVLEKYKEKAGTHANAQNDIIASLAALNDKLQARIQTLEKASVPLPSAGGVFEAGPAIVPPAKADPKEVRALKEDLAKVQSALKGKDEKILSLEREIKAEVEHSRLLQATAKAGGAPSLAASISTTPEEAEKDAQSLKLYEDMTDLNIMNVKIKQGAKNGKEVTFNCVQTVEGRSLNFKLRACNELDLSLVAAKADNPWIKSVIFQPVGLENEADAEFAKRLGIFATEFSVRKDELGELWRELKSRISVNGVFDESMDGVEG